MSQEQFVPRPGPGGPAELPEGGEGGGGIVPRPGEIAELPLAVTGVVSPLLNEVVRLRARLQSVEAQLLSPAAAQLRIMPLPEIAELPEGGEGGGGGVVPRPEIAELPPFDIAALQERIVRLEATLTALSERVQQLEGR